MREREKENEAEREERGGREREGRGERESIASTAAEYRYQQRSLPATMMGQLATSDEFPEDAIPPDGISRPVSGRMNRFSRALTRVSYVPLSRRDCNVDAMRPTAPRHSSCLGLTAVSSSSARPDGNLMAYSPRTRARLLAKRFA